jgi:hypothetical protein
MNLDQIEKHLLQKTVKLRPQPRYQRPFDSMEVDWAWRVSGVDTKLRRVQLMSHQYCFQLGSDHIREFVQDIATPHAGFFALKVQVLISGDNIRLEPIV